MRALVVREFGGPLLLEDLPVPRPGPQDVLLRVKACAVDQFDLTIRDGRFAMANKLPIVLGHEIAGVVEAVGLSFAIAFHVMELIVMDVLGVICLLREAGSWAKAKESLRSVTMHAQPLEQTAVTPGEEA